MRHASAGDIPALALVWHDAWHAGHAHLDPEIAARRPMAFFIERMSAPLEEYSVAADNGRVVGFSRWEGDGIAQVFVLPAYHRTGVAALVLRAAEEALLAQGHTRIWLQCRKGNDRARRFYEKHGWIVVADVDHDMGHMDGRSPVIVWRLEKSLV